MIETDYEYMESCPDEIVRIELNVSRIYNKKQIMNAARFGWIWPITEGYIRKIKKNKETFNPLDD